MRPAAAGSVRMMSSNGDVIGVDLGTTNSCVAIMEGKMEAKVPAPLMTLAPVLDGV